MRSLGLACVTLIIAGCQLLAMGPTGGAYPGACAGMKLTDRRCAAVVERARGDAAVDPTAITSIEIAPPQGDDTVRLGGIMVARVQFRLADGHTISQDVWCTGVGSNDDRACRDDPQIGLSGGVDHDVPCAGEAPAGDPNGCATLPPTPPPAAVAAARPLRVDVLEIPLDHLGQYEIEVGQAGLPNGHLSRREFDIADRSPKNFWIQGGVLLDVRPTLDGRPQIGSIYRDPFDGIEPVEAFLVFEVTETSPGAVLQIRNLVVE